MKKNELEKIKNLPLNDMWINAFALVGRPSEELIKHVGESVLRELKRQMIESQNKKPPEYPYEIVFRFHSS
jgi:hypothetical protein